MEMIWSFIKTYWDKILTAIFSASIVFFAYRQHMLERTRLKLDLYDRRRLIYSVLKTFIIEFQIGGISALKEAQRSLREKTKETKFLFKENDGIDVLRDELLIKSMKIILNRRKLENNSLSNEEKDNIVNEEAQLMQWIREQGAVIDSKFEKYLHLS